MRPDAYPDVAGYAHKLDDLRRRVANVAASLGGTYQRLDFLQTALTEYAAAQAASARLSQQLAAAAAAGEPSDGGDGGGHETMSPREGGSGNSDAAAAGP